MVDSVNTGQQSGLLNIAQTFSITHRARLDAIESIAYAQKQAADVLDKIPVGTLLRLTEAQQQQAQLLANMVKPINEHAFTNLRQTLAVHSKAFQSIAFPSQQLLSSITVWQKTLHNSVIADLKRSANSAVTFHLNFETPQLLMPELLEEADVIDVIETEPKLLTVTIDRFGSFQIGDHKIVRANANSSRHGKLLKYLENNKDEMISNSDIKENIKVGTPAQVMKDLKKELRLLGYSVDYVRYRGQGLVYHGIINKQ